MKKTADDPKRDRRDRTKLAQLEEFREFPEGTTLTTDQGVPIPHTDDSLRGGTRGPTLLEDFHLREKITRFDHERIPERVVHARGSGAHGHFQVYKSLAELTAADFLQDPAVRTPVFVRFSTVQGSRGSADTVRDVRGFATKFYTRAGNFDLVGNNMPVFFIQDGIKFADFVHAVKPEPHHEMPQGASAHDSFWDFISLVPETTHMVLWLMSDRAIPRSLRMMEGFGVHTFKLVNASGRVRLCKFHWKPLLGAHSLVWDEAQKLAGKDPDFHRRDLWEAIDGGMFPDWELGLQVVDEQDELAYGIDLLDPTKLLPEEVVPVQRVGKMTLDRNPDNFFAETEQVAFCVQNLVPGIDVTDDPLMQARMFSYLDTQLTRLGGPNFAELPINRPVVPVHNHQQDGFGSQRVPTTRANYHPNSIGDGCPFLAGATQGFVHRPEPLEGVKTRARSDTFLDHFTQARLFLDSQSPAERAHMVQAFRFELGKVGRAAIRERMVQQLAKVDPQLATDVALGLGLAGTVTARAPARPATPDGARTVRTSPALSLANQPKDSIRTRKVAILATDGASATDVQAMTLALAERGAIAELVADRVGSLRFDDGSSAKIAQSILTASSVMYDAVYVPSGAASAATLMERIETIDFLRDAHHHAKTIGVTGEGAAVLRASVAGIVELSARERKTSARAVGILVAPAADDAFTSAFCDALQRHRHFEREPMLTPSRG